MEEIIKIALVDDDKISSKIITRNLKNKGASKYPLDIVMFSSGEDLFDDKINLPTFSVFIIDENLGPGHMKGKDIIKKLKTDIPNSQTILYTGKEIALEELSDILETGFSSFIVAKPIDYTDLITKILSAHEAYNLRKQYDISEENRTWIRSLIDGFPDEVTVMDRQQKIIFANKAVFDKYPEEIIKKKKHCYNIFKGQKVKCEMCLCDKVMETKETHSTPYDYYKGNILPDEKEYFIEETVTPIFDNDGNVEFLLSVAKDVTTRVIIRDIENKIKFIEEEEELIEYFFTKITEIGIERIRYYKINHDLNILERVKTYGKHEDLNNILELKDRDWIFDKESDYFTKGYRVFTRNNPGAIGDIGNDFRENTIAFLLKSGRKTLGVLSFDFINGELRRDIIPYFKSIIRLISLKIIEIRNSVSIKIMSDISPKLIKHLSINELTKNIVQEISKKLNIEMVTFFTYNKETSRIESRAINILGLDNSSIKKEFREESFNFEDNVSGKVINEKKAIYDNDIKQIHIIKEDVSQWPYDFELITEYETECLKSGRVHSGVFIPLIFQDSRIGLLRCINKLKADGNILETGFREDEFELLKRLGDLISSTLAIGHYKEKVSKVSEIIRYIMEEEKSSDIDRTWFLILTAITMGKGLGFNRAILAIYENGRLKVKRAVGPSSKDVADKIWKLRIWKDNKDSEIIKMLDIFKEAYDNENYSIFETKDNNKEWFLSELFNKRSADLELSESFLQNLILEQEEDYFYYKELSRSIKIQLNYDTFFQSEVISQNDISSLPWAALPLEPFNNKGRIGFLYVDNRFNGDDFSTYDLELLKFFTDLISQVLANANDYKLALKLNEVLSKMTDVQSLDELFNIIEGEISHFPKVDDFCLIAQKDERFEPVSRCKNSENSETCKSCFSRLIHSERDLSNVLIHLHNEQEIIKLFGGHYNGVNSRIIINLYHDDKAIGFLILDNRYPNIFTEFDIERYKNLGSHLAIIINKIKIEKQTEEYLEKLSHNIRIDLLAFLGFFEAIKLNLVSEIDEIKIRSTDCYERINPLVEKILLFEKAQEVKEPKSYVFKVNDLCPLIRELQEKYAQIFKFAFKEEEILFRYDKSYFSLAIDNLIDNAIKYSKNTTQYPPEIIIENGKASFMISVVSFGEEIIEKDKIFEKWYRPDKHSAVNGSGLGLNIVKNIIDEHGGKIAVSSDFQNEMRIFRNSFIISLFKNEV